MDEREKLIAKVKKILALSNNNPSEEEAKAAALKAQRLMADYHLTLDDVDKAEQEFICEAYVMIKDVMYGSALASVIAKGFCCKCYMAERDSNDIVVFYGHKTDAEIASETYKYLYLYGQRKANEYYNKATEIEKLDDIILAFKIGFLKGVDEALTKQGTSLMIVVPKDVTNGFELMVVDNNTTSRNKMETKTMQGGRDANEEGRRTGKAAIESRRLESTVKSIESGRKEI